MELLGGLVHRSLVISTRATRARQLRAGLDIVEFEWNWASGERLGLGDPGQLIAEWI